ncbi:MAG: DUF4435 domain-containing protein [Prevotella sp.]|jgi:hypothetical protein|nr:DUF4435 domain-containing protein [Prevotella sp.]
MGKRLRDNLNSNYFEAANALTSKKARHRIVAYVESYDDIYFWRTVLGEFENDKRYFEVMLPSKVNLTRGKKSVLMNFLEGEPLGKDMIACVDADYDYLLQRRTRQSAMVLDSPYVFHTYVYAIENFQCYAPSLHNVCVSVTLNDHRIFDFRTYFQLYSEVLFPLFVWSIMLYRNGNYPRFSISDFNRISDPGGFNMHHPEPSISNVRRKVRTKINDLQRQFPDAKEEYLATKADLLALGVTPQTTYLYIQGHHLFDTVVSPILSKVCNVLRQERQNEIYHAAAHKTQKHNEMTCYENSLQDIKVMLKKNSGYMASEQFRRIQDDIRQYLDSY